MPDVTQQLLDVLDSLDTAAQFCTAGSLPPVLPGLQVQGVGEIGVPVQPAQAQQLMQQAVLAPYGRGEETIVDPAVRRVWQIEPAQCSLHNPAWQTFMAGIVDTVKQDFGIDDEVQWHLYKLLIYEQGSFFAPHRDSEKADGMFATLVICLPSRHQGGSLIVSHDGQSKTIDCSGEEAAYNVQYAAFYTDCQHEITPVTSGYRVCLIYNLTIAQRQQQPTAPRHGTSVEQVATLLTQIFADPQQDKIAIALEHEYSEAGLSPTTLKGADRSRLAVLERAADRLGYQLYLALMTHYQEGGVEDDSWYDEDEDDAEMGEIYEESLTLNYWLDAQGHAKAFGAMQLKEEEILSAADLDDFLTQQEVHEATGNEGVTMERWYRHAMIVLWPPDRYFRILAGEGQAAAVPALAELLDGAQEPAQHAAARTFATEIINRWQPPRYTYTGNRESQSASMLRQLPRLADPALALRFIQEILVKDYNGTEGQPLNTLGDMLGWETLAPALTHFIASQVPGERTASLLGTVAIFKEVCCRPEAMTVARQTACRSMATALTQVISQWDKRPGPPAWERDRESRAGLVEALFQACGALAEPALLEQFLAHALSVPEHYDLHTVLIPTVQKMQHEVEQTSPGWSGYRQLLTHCIAALQSLTHTPVPVPTDWAQHVTIKCACADCQELQQFLRDPQEQVHRFRVRKERRQHLHQQIDAHRCDMTHVTDRRGSPQTLVCTKNRASYERQQQQFDNNVRLLAALRGIAVAS